MIRIRQFLFALNVFALIGFSIATNSAVAAVNDAESHCQALVGQQFVELVDAPAQITQARLSIDAGEILQEMARFAPPDVVAEAQKALAGIQPFCHVSGYVLPSVGFELLLPVSHWNGKFLHVGCGGWCGSAVVLAEDILTCARHSDYACISTDMGHTSSVDGFWFRNNLQAQIDFSYRATHMTTLAGKAITERYYSSAPKRSYFDGCSTGGYQGMVEAQLYPFDFNGIIAGAPDMDEGGLSVRYMWIKQNFFEGPDDHPVLSPDDLQVLHQAALARCDMDDGVKDGIIGDPVHCEFDPQVLLCTGAKSRQCLTAQQVRAVKNIYGVPVTSTGVPLFSGRGKFPGSENQWTSDFAETWGDVYFKDTALLTVPGKEWKYTDFDLDRDYGRSGIGGLFSETNPDLRVFKAAGGKLLSYQGGNDNEEVPGAIVDYYETVEKTMGGRKETQDFFRLFVIPGMEHCRGGVGADAADFLGSLEAWVERGQKPDRILSGHFKNISPVEALAFGPPYPYREFPKDTSQLSFTRPLYPYPLYAKYKGTGDPNRAENFTAVAPR